MKAQQEQFRVRFEFMPRKAYKNVDTKENRAKREAGAPIEPLVGTLRGFDMTHLGHLGLLHIGLRCLLKSGKVDYSNPYFSAYKNQFDGLRHEAFTQLGKLYRTDPMIQEILDYFLSVEMTDSRRLLEVGEEVQYFVDGVIHYRVNFKNTRSDDDKTKLHLMIYQWCLNHPEWIPADMQARMAPYFDVPLPPRPVPRHIHLPSNFPVQAGASMGVDEQPGSDRTLAENLQLLRRHVHARNSLAVRTAENMRELELRFFSPS